MYICSYLSIPIPHKRCDGDQGERQDSGCSEKRSSHQLEEDWSHPHQVSQVRLVEISNPTRMLVQEEGHQWRRSSSRVLGSRGGKQPKEEEEGGWETLCHDWPISLFPGRGYDVKLNQPKVPPVSSAAAKPTTKDPAKAPG